MTILKIGGNAESETAKFVMPVDGAVGVYFTNVSQTKLKNNFIADYLPNTVALSPLINSDYTTFGSSVGYVQTDISELDNFTIITVFKVPTTISKSSANVFSTFSGDPSTYGSGILVQNDGVKSIASQTTASGKTSGTSASITATKGVWGLFVSLYDGNKNTVKSITEKKQSSYTTGTGRLVGTTPVNYRIGNAYLDLHGNDIDVMCVAVYDRALSDSEIDSVSDVLRRYAAKHGVTV